MVTPSGIRNWDPSGIDSLLKFENIGTLDHSATTADSFVKVIEAQIKIPRKSLSIHRFQLSQFSPLLEYFNGRV